MPRGKKNAAPKANGKSEPARTTIRMIDEASFKRLVNQCRGAQHDMDEARVTKGGLISSAVEKKHLDKKAFGIFNSLSKMSDEKLATTLAHFDYYRRVGGLDDRADKQGQLIDQSAEIEQAGENVVSLTQTQREEIGEFEPEAA